MFDFIGNLKILLPLVLAVFATTSAEAGFISMDSPAAHQLSADESGAFRIQSAASSGTSDKHNPQELPGYLKDLTLDQLQFGNSPGNGMSSSSVVSSGGSSAPAAILNDFKLPHLGPISPLCLREIPFTPQMLIAEIFRPPCA